MRKKHLYSYIFIILFLLTGCLPNNIQPDPLIGKLKSIKVYDTIQNSPVYHVRLSYNEQEKIDSIVFYQQQFAPDTIGQFAFYTFTFAGNEIFIESNGFNVFYPIRRFKAYLEENKINKIVEIDESTGIESSYMHFVKKSNNLLDSIYSPDNFPLTANRKSYNFNFDGNNYIEFDYQYTEYVFSSSYERSGSVVLDYTSIPRNVIAPGQLLLQSSILSSIGSSGELFIDFLYYLSIDYNFNHIQNTNLIASINNLSFIYEFNNLNHLSKCKLMFPDVTTLHQVFEYEYY
jgi:hypothetical protein